MSASQSQSMMTEFAALLASNVRMEAELAEIKQLLSQQPKAPKAKQSKKAVKAESEAEGAEPKEKRLPSPWIQFTVRVQGVLRPAEAGKDKAERTSVGTMNQFASTLWPQAKEGKEWSDEEISAAWAAFTPPEVSKQEAEGKSKRSGSISSGGGAEPVAEDGTKSRKGGKWSEEAKASAKAKREAKKAAKAEAEAEAEVDVWGHVEVEAEAPAPATPAKKEAEPAPAPAKKVMQIKKAAPAPKKLDLSFYSITHEGADYFTNDRHDLVDAEMVWVGRLLNGKIVEAEEPEDLADATMRE